MPRLSRAKGRRLRAAPPNSASVSGTPARLRVRVRGVVQGVGFRPFVYGLANRFDLSGFVLNDSDGVLIEIEGAHAGAFDALTRERPPLARIEAVETQEISVLGSSDFTIEHSAGGSSRTRISPDVAVCDACLDDLFDPQSRFHLYPFVTCTHCGPRFTLTRKLPYDRAQTSMASFAMCADCARDYRDPTDRRFHAEPIACPACGPKLTHQISDIVAALRAGKIVALKGIGGFHLMCDATNEATVAELRRRKAREAKPFAVMAANLAVLERIAIMTDNERVLIASPQRPIVLARDRGLLAPSIAPGLDRIGVVLPYAPLHHLIFQHEAGYPVSAEMRASVTDLVLVATSANPGGEPLITDDAEACEKLDAIADLIVGHDRAIVTRADDSVMAIFDGAPAFLRRARGFVPEPVDLGADGPCTLALGADLKATVCVTRGREAFVSQHIGSLDNVATIRFHEETTRHLIDILDVEPEIVACDLHPDFWTTRRADELGPPVVRVQHHAAHVAAIAAEHGIDGPCLGLALDGHGFGDDGAAWGGEALLVDNISWKRLGHLAPLALPGGDRAAREPWRMGVAALQALGRLDEAQRLFPDVPAAGALARALGGGLTVPTTTSAGRLFDAAAALVGTCRAQRYEAQAAMELEALVQSPSVLDDGWRIADGVLDFAPLLGALADAGLSPREGADLFHGTFAAGVAQWAAGVARTSGHRRVALGGGCLLNRVVTELLAAHLRAVGLEPLLARAVPPNDGGLSLGQAYFARNSAIARLAEAD